jgi:hypothetical protein
MVDPSGAFWISGPTGFVAPALRQDPKPYTHDTSMFKSTDGGRTWVNAQQVPGYGRDPCPGGGDSDITASPDGTVYLLDLNLVNSPVDVSKDGGKTWLFNCNSSIVPGIDRQWIAASNKFVWVSVTQGVTDTAADLKVVDQKDGTLYLAGNGAEMEVSTDDGLTFTDHETGLKGHDISKSFISIALDAQGNAFVAGAGAKGIVVSGSTDKGKTWTPGVEFMPYSGKGSEYAFAWIAAGSAGTIDMAWYGQPPHASSNTTYFVYAAQKTDFFAEPGNATFGFTQVTPQPIATKPLCQSIRLIPPPPTPCDADGTHTRALGDFFESAVDNDGRFVIAYNDANGHVPPQLKFAKQAVGVLAPPQRA